MHEFPKTALPLRAALLAALALYLVFSMTVPAAYAASPELPEPGAPSPNCNGDECLYIPSVISGGGAQPARSSISRSQSVTLYRQMYVPSNVTSDGWNGTHDPCSAGATAQPFRAAVLTRVNYFRQMAGIPPLKGLRDDLNTQEQEAALMMSRNKTLSHTPAGDWACATSNGQTAAGRSNLALGVNGPAAIDMYMNDTGLSSLGHRRWILYPQTQWAATGDIPASNGYPATNAFRTYDDNVFGPRPQTRDGFVAWPPAAYVPYQVVYPYWSFAFPDANFSNASVQVTAGGKSVALTKFAQVDGFGENTLVWSMDGMSGAWPKPSGDSAYQVSIRGVTVNGSPRDFSYTVTIIDPNR